MNQLLVVLSSSLGWRQLTRGMTTEGTIVAGTERAYRG